MCIKEHTKKSGNNTIKNLLFLKKTKINKLLNRSALFLLAALATLSPATQANQGLEQLKLLSLEDLANIEITIASKSPQKISNTAAATFVITQEDIRRSSATTLPELFAMVPGMHVARVDRNKWAINTRGFNDGRFSNKLLVLVDGRSVYSPTFSGVFWDTQQVILDDIERIEIIRGSGASVWGANAVSGVINIITKTASDTQGNLLVAAAGNEEQGLNFRHGGQISDNTHYRIYGKAFSQDNSISPTGTEAIDEWEHTRFGFRIDSGSDDASVFTLQAEVFDNEADQLTLISDPITFTNPIVPDTSEREGWFILGRWERNNAASDTILQVYLDFLDQQEAVLGQDEQLTADIDFQQSFEIGKHIITWGAGYRNIDDDTTGSAQITFTPEDAQLDLYSAFIQDEISLMDNRLLITVGSKFEENDFTGTEVQPSARLLWQFDDSSAIWTSLSRASRTPSISENSVNFDQLVFPPNPPLVPLPLTIRFTGNENLDAEVLNAFEFGYRNRLTDSFGVDVAFFYNEFDGLYTAVDTGTIFEPQPIPTNLVNVITQTNDNSDINSYGMEVVVDWRPRDWWRIQTTYSFLDGDDVTSPTDPALGPKNQLSARSLINIRDDVELDIWVRWVDDLPEVNVGDFWNMDVRVAWLPKPDLSIELIGRNLVDSERIEFGTPSAVESFPNQTEQEILIQARWNFD